MNVPRRLAVIGGGAIGSEMGQALARLGSEVTIVQRAPRLLPRETPEVSEILQTAFEDEGISLLLSANPVRVSQDGTNKVVEVEQHGQSTAIPCDDILVAAGRKPVIESLNLQAAAPAEQW